jgi:tRNA-2-methylthio-N6-dimethylallyladenosine synthase
VVEEAGFDAAYTFQYSPRPGTVAAGFDEQIPKDVVQERFDRLLEVQERISLERSRAQEGRIVEVLVEGVGKKGGLQGRTRANRVVNFRGPGSPGDFVPVRVVRGHPHHLTGETVSAAVGA